MPYFPPKPNPDRQFFSTSGTWTKPAGAAQVEVIVIGGGGGGCFVITYF